MLFVKKYFQIIAQNYDIANNSVIICNKSSFLTFRLNSLGIENFLPIPSQYLYLFLQTNASPFLSRKYKSKKKWHFGESQTDTAKISVYAGQLQHSYALYKFMKEFMKNQLSPEQSAI